MKLNLGENIRTCRRRMDLTQEQLAERLGVSFQSVSRWENGSTYPDMELLPVLAGVFGVTVDWLLGLQDEKIKEQFEKMQDTFRSAAAAHDQEEIVSILMELCRDWELFVQPNAFWIYNDTWTYGLYRNPEILNALRCLTEKILHHSTEKWHKSFVIREMSCMEDDEHIEMFLQDNATEQDLSENALRRERYRMRGEWDKLEKERKRHLCLTLDNVLWNGPDLWQTDKMNKDPEYALWQNDCTLSFLHCINKESPDPLHPVRGKNGIDIWAEARLSMGFRRAACLTALGRTDEIWTVLEDTVSLLEDIMCLPDKLDLSCTSPALGDFTIPAKFCWMPDNWNITDPALEEKHFEYHMADGTCWWVVPRTYYCFLTDRQMWGYTDWTWFDPIREDPRYLSYIDRVKACIITRPAQE